MRFCSFPKIMCDFTTNLKDFVMSDIKYNRLRIVMVQKEKAGLWLGNKIGKSNCTVSKYINQLVQSDLRTLYDIANALHIDVRGLLVSNLNPSE